MKEREVRKRKRSFLSFLLIMAMVIQTLSPMAVEAKTIDAKDYSSVTGLTEKLVDAGDELVIKNHFTVGMKYFDCDGTLLYTDSNVNSSEEEYTYTVLSYQNACEQSGGTDFQLKDSTFKSWRVTYVSLSAGEEEIEFTAVSTLEREITYVCEGAYCPYSNPKTFIAGVGVSGIEPASKYDSNWNTIYSTGWYRNPQFTGEPVTSIPATETENVTLYAKFPAVTHTITYKDETDTVITTFVSGANTTVSNPSVYEEGVGVSSLYDAYKEGFLFGGWYTDLDNENTKVTEIGSNETDNITLFAKFIPTKSINYELYGGTLSEGAPTYYAVGEGIPADNMPTATKAHHDFTGWYESANDGAAQITSIATDSAVDLTLHAKYTPKTYEIVYHDGETTGAAVQVDNPGTYTYGGAEIASLNHADKTGQEFLGWYRESSLENAVTSITADNVAQLLGDDGKLHLYAKYAANTYNITYHDGDSILTGSAITTYTYGAGVAEENMWQPTKAHYAFEGWYSDNTLAADKKVTSISNDRTGDIDLYAKFTGDVFHIVYLDENDGTVSVPTDAAVTYTYGEDPVYPCYLEPGSIVRGHRSAGWFKDKNFDNDASEVSEITTANAVQLADSDGTIRLYTKFVPMTYKLKYYVDGEQVQVEGNPDEYVYGTAEIDEATLKDATKDGYRFDGWYSQGEPVVKVGVINDAIAELAVYDGPDCYVRLDARFTKMYEVVYHDGSKIIAASGNPNAASYPEGSTINLKEVSKDGYDFDGWYADSDLQGDEVTAITAANTTALTGTDGKLHLYAKYTPKTYSIKYMVDGTENTTLTPKTYTHGTGVAKQAMPSAPAKQNYDFDAWYTEPDGGGTKMESIPDSKYGDITLYAHYMPRTYQITYKVDGVIDTQTGNPANYVYGTGAAITQKPVREGYTFKGWYDNRDYIGNEVTQVSNIKSGPLTLYGKFVAEDYQITYIVGEGATAPASPTGYTYGVGVPADQMPQATKTGWSFKGWYSDNSWADNKKVESIGTTEQGNKTLYAKFEIIDYAIEYYYNGGQAVANPTYYHYGTGTDTLLPTSKNGYTFDGWYLSSDFEDGTKVDKIAADMTGKKKLYAKFTPDTYAIAYQTNGGTNSTQNPVSYTYGIVTGAGIELKPAEKTGYDFKDWYSDAGLTSDSAVKALSDANVYQLADADKKVTLYAAYTGKTYDIVYETNGGTNATTNPVKYQCGTENKVLAKATKENYVCDGWYSTASFAAGTEVTELNDAVVTSLASGTSVTLYAKYTGEEYEIEYKLDGGTNHADNPTHYNFGTGVAGFEDASKPHYVFDGWYNNDSFVTKIEKIGPQESGKKTLYAKFTGEAYTIVYQLDGGQNHTDNKSTYLYGNGGITPKDAKKDGYGFAGWYTSADLAQTSKVTTLTDAQILALAGTDKKITLYADYTPNQYDIVYHDGTATNAGGENETSYTFGTTLALKDGAAKNGYDFKNWYAVSSLEGDTVASITEQNALDLLNAQDHKLHLYAKYDHASYPITYETNGGVLTGSAVNLYTHGTGIAKADMAKAEKDYYDFEGWYGEAALQNKVESISTTTYGAIKLYANYTPKEYEIRYHLQAGDTNGEGNPTKYTYGVGVDIFKPATRRGYTFKGWFDNPDLIAGEVTEITAQDHGDMLLWPKFEEEDYKITYIVDGKEDNAAGNPTGYKFGVGVAAADLKDASKNGYAFDGWYRDLNDEDSKVTSVGTDETGDLTLYAKFTGLVYTIQYETDGGTNAVTNPSQYQCGTEEKVLAKATKEHYVCDGWYSTASFDAGTKVTQLNDTVVTSLASGTSVTLYAKYTGEEYGIEYKLNGGTNHADNPAKYNYGTGVAKFEDASKPHYVFDGWYNNENFATKIEKIGPQESGNKTLYAKFTGEAYTIVYHLNGGSNHTDNKGTYLYGTGGITPKDAKKDGYTPDGWYTSDDLAQTSKVTTLTDEQILALAGPGKTINLYAGYTPNQYNIVYHDGTATNAGGENETSYTFGETLELKDGAAKNGYDFKNWYAVSSLEGDTVASITEQNALDLLNAQDHKLHLYAKYDHASYPITYETNGGVLTGSAVNLYTHGTGIAKADMAKAEKDYYDFEGWYGEAALQNKVESISTTTYGAIKLYANYTPKEYEIRYHLQAGDTNGEGNPTKYTYGVGVDSFKPATRRGYTFKGWFDNPDLIAGEVTEITAQDHGDMLLWPKFEEEDYKITYIVDGKEDNAAGNPTGYKFGVGVAAADLKDASKNGYAFDGWYRDLNDEDSKVTSVGTDETGDLILYAKFTGLVYTIQYETDGGTNAVTNPSQYQCGTGDKTLADAAKEHYAFLGWYSNENFTQDSKVTKLNDAVVTGLAKEDKVVLYAKYAGEEYDIEYKLNGGQNSATNPVKYTYGTGVEKFEDAAKEHYEFIGWYDNEQLTGDPVSSISTTATGKKTLWARFEGEEYTIEYVLNDGINAADNPHTYTYGNGGITLKSATRPGYTFDSFYTTENFAQGTAVKAMTDAQIVAAADDDRVLTLYAKFTPDTYTITYQTNGGENSKENPTSYTYGIVTGAGIELKPAEKNGYEFKDWHADAGMTGNAVVKALSDNMVYEVADAEKKVTLYAEYTGKTYNIVYETNGGTNANTNPAQYQCGTAEVTLADATRTNYGFGGWYSAADFAENTKVTKLTDKVVTDLEKNGTVTLYAKLTGDEYEIEYKTDGGQNPASNPAKYTIGKGVEKFEDAVKEHYEFMGWYDNEGFERDRITSIREDESGRKTLWAKFEGEEYTIDYRLDGGSNAEDNPETYRYGTGGFTLKPAVKENYTFVNFYTTENFAEGTAVKTMTDAQIIAAADDDRVITLYAQYSGKEYEIEYVLNGGTNNEANPTHYNHAVGVAKFEDATKEYYVFEGWYDNAQFDGEKVSSIGAQESGKKTLYAKFTADTFKIKYELFGGTNDVSNPAGYTYGVGVAQLKAASKPGYIFAGWYRNANFTGNSVTSITAQEYSDVTLYAKYVEGPKDLSLDERSMNDIILSAGLVITQSPEQINVKWGKVKGADGYEVYVTYCHLAFPKTPIRVTTKKTNKTNFNKILGKNVNLRRDFKVYVKAFKKVNGKKVTIAESIIGHMAAINHTKYTNVEKLKVKKKVAGIKVGQTFKIKAKTTLMAKGKKQLSNKHEPEFRYISTNPGVAQVDEKGVITAIGKGECVVYLFARDGRSAYVRVKVS